jgi:hypothetical protein
LSVAEKESKDEGSNLLHELNYRARHELGSSVAEFLQSHKTRIGFTQNAVTIARDNLTTFQRFPKVLLDLVVGNIVPNLFEHR